MFLATRENSSFWYKGFWNKLINDFHELRVPGRIDITGDEIAAIHSYQHKHKPLYLPRVCTYMFDVPFALN